MHSSWYGLTLAVSLVLPWRISERARALPRPGPALAFAAFSLALGACLGPALSSWTYMVGKGLVLGLDQMDLGADDLPPDTFAQVALGLAGAGLLWLALLGLVVGVCILVADSLFLSDRGRFRAAALSAALLTPWLVVGTIALIAVNGILLDEVVHPVEALRAYSQARQTGWAPTALGVRERVLWLGAGFSVIWASALVGLGPFRRGLPYRVVVALAIAFCGAAWWVLSRTLPWTALQALAG